MKPVKENIFCRLGEIIASENSKRVEFDL